MVTEIKDFFVNGGFDLDCIEILYEKTQGYFVSLYIKPEKNKRLCLLLIDYEEVNLMDDTGITEKIFIEKNFGYEWQFYDRYDDINLLDFFSLKQVNTIHNFTNHLNEKIFKKWLRKIK